MNAIEAIAAAAPSGSGQEELYQQAVRTYGAALERLARAYEADLDLRLDLLQEIHVLRQRRLREQTLVGLEELENLPDSNNAWQAADRSHSLERLLNLIQRLKPIDRHVILSYLEGFDAASIGEITGLSAGNVATKIHRIKSMLARQFQQGGSESCVK